MPTIDTISAEPTSSLYDALRKLGECEGRTGLETGRKDSEIVSTLENNPPPPIDGSISSCAVALLKRLKIASKAFPVFSSTFEQAYNTLRELAMPSILHHGILSLPPEILSRVAMLTHPSLRRPYPAFSLVCRRFREIELSTPELWTFVNGKMSPEHMTLQIERAGGMDMSFEIVDGGCGYWGCDCRWKCRCDMWTVIAANAERWKRARVYLLEGAITEEMFGTPVMDVGENADPEEHILCLHKLRGIEIPKLEYLDLDVLQEEDEGVSFIGSWSMPNLKFLVFKAELQSDPLPEPKTVIPLSSETKLESFKLKVSWNLGKAKSGVAWVEQVLKTECLTNLSRLELVFEEKKPFNNDNIIENQSQTTVPSADQPIYFNPFNHVTHLSVSLLDTALAYDGPSGPNALLSILLPQLPHLTPNVSSLRISAAFSVVENAAFRAYLASLRILCAKLTEVRITLYQPSSGMDEEKMRDDVRYCILDAGSQTRAVHDSAATLSSSGTDVPIRVIVAFVDKPLFSDVPSYELERVGFDEETEDWKDYAGPYAGPRYAWTNAEWKW